MQTFGEYLKEKEKRNTVQRVKAYTPEEAESAKFAKWDEAVKQRRSEIRWENIGGDNYDSYISDLSERMKNATDYKSASALLPDVRTAIERTNQMQGWLNEFGTDEQQKTYDFNSMESELRDYISALEAEGDERKRLRYDVMDAEDFEQYSKPATEKKSSLFGVLGDYRYDYINDVEGTRSGDGLYTDYDKMRDKQYGVYVRQMTEDEKGIYNYIYAKEGKERADEYLASIEQALNAREAGDIVDVTGSNFLTKGLLAFAIGVESAGQGLTQFASTITGNEEALPLTPTQIASQQVQSELDRPGRLLYGGVQSVGQMLPSILLSMATGGIAGAAGATASVAQGLSTATSLWTFGSSAAGNAYQQAVMEGADPDDAKLYAFSVGVSEVTLQYLLGGIGKLGGKVASKLGSTIAPKVNSVFNGINNSLLRNTLKSGTSLVGKMVSEGTEEGLQEFFEPALAAFTLDKDYEFDLDNAIDAFLIGGLTAGMMEGGGTVANVITDDRFQQLESYLGKSKVDYFSGIDSLGDLNRAYVKLTGKKHSESVESDIERQYVMRKAFFGGSELMEALQSGADSKALMREEIKKAEPTLTDEEIKAAFAELDDSIVRERAMNATSSERGLAGALAEETVGASPYAPQTAQSVLEAGLAERRDAINGFFRESAKAGVSYADTKAILKARGVTDLSEPEAFRAYSLALNEAAAESRTSAEVPSSEASEPSGAGVEVQAIERIEDGQVMLKLADGSVVEVNEVEFDNADEELLYRAAEGMTTAAANAMIGGYDTASIVDPVQYTEAWREAYNYGKAMLPTRELASAAELSVLTSAQMRDAYQAGRSDSIAERKNRFSNTADKPAEKGKRKGKKEGALHREFAERELNDRQSASLDALDTLASALGIDIHVFESEVDANGERVGANGWYDPSDGSIHIDLHAGISGEGTILFTAAHELVHYIRDNSPEKFGVLADFLMERYGEQGVSVRDLIVNQINKAKRNDRTISFDTAYEEVIADSMESMLSDGKVIERIAELKAKDKTLFERMREYFRSLAERIRAAYKGLKPDSREGRYVAEMMRETERLQALFTDALVDASERGQKNNAGDGVSKFSYRDEAPNAFNPEGKTLEQQLREAMDSSTSKERRYVYVGRFTQNFVNSLKEHINIEDYPIVMNYRDAYLSMETKEKGKYHGEGINYHNLGVDGLRSALESLDDPEYVMLSAKSGKIELVLEGRDYKNRQLFSVVEINTKTQNNQKFMDAHVVVSVYGNRGVQKRIETAESEGRLIYSKKEEPTQGMPQVQYERDINANSSNSSISQPDDSVKRKFSDRDYTDLETHFGTTRNYDVAGYLMIDGKMLDFSGRHWGDTSSDFRQVDYRDVYEVEAIESEFNNGRDAMVAMIGDGNIRLNPESGGINLAVLPNVKQITTLRGYINHFRGEVVVDVDDAGGNTLHSFEYNKGTSADRIIADIKRYFEDGTIPEAQSGIGQFRYSDRDYAQDFTSRGILTRAKEDDAHTPAEKQRLAEYQTMRAEYDTLEVKRSEISDRLRIVRASDGSRNKAYWDEFNRLRNESIETANKLTNLEKRLRSYEGSKTLSRLIDRERRRQMELFDRQNREEYRNARSEYVVERSRSELRRKILSEFNKLNRRLLNPTKTDHIPEVLREPVTEALRVLNMDTSEADSRIEYYEKLIASERGRISGLRKDLEMLEPQERSLLGDLAKAKSEVAAARSKLKEAEADYQEKRAPVKALDEERKALYRELDAEHDEAKKNEIRQSLRKMGKELMDLKAKREVASAERNKAKEALKTAERKLEQIEGELAKLEKVRKELPEAEKNLDSYIKTVERLEAQGTKLDGVLSELQTAYEKILLEPDDEVVAEYNKDISEKIVQVKHDVGSTALRSMSVTQLEEVYELLTMIRTVVANKNKLFNDARNQTVEEAGREVMKQVDDQGREIRRRGKEKIDQALDTLAKWGWGNEKPTYAIDRIGAERLMELQHDILMGQNVAAQDMEEGRLFRIAEQEKYGFKEWKLDETHEFTAKNGKTFKITTAEIMSLYAYSKRPQAWDHLEIGGFTFKRLVEKTKTDVKGNKKTYYVEEHQTYNLSRDQVAQISGVLTAGQRAFVDSMQDYLSTVMGAKGNKVSMLLYGIKIFKEKFYFPLKTDKQYQVEMGKVAGERTVVSSGMTKNTVKGANNPIVLEGFMEVWGKHVEQMSTYHGLALPLENFHRVLSYKEKGSTDGKSAVSVKASITTAHGKAATDYLSQYLTDLNGGLKADPKEVFGGVMLGRFKKAAVLGSMSVFIQQPTSIVRALDELHPKYFVGERLSKQKHAALWAEIKKYAGVAVVKEAGGYDTGTSGSMVDYIIGKDESVMDKVDDFLGRAPAYADEVTWCKIWQACLREQAALHPELKGEALKKAAGERFTVVIDRTQVYDSVVSKSQHMRSKNAYMNMITAFLGEPTTSINMREKALRHFRKGEWGKVARTTASVWGASLLAAVASSLVYATRDDDEDETWAEKFLSSLTVEALDALNPLTALPIVKDVWSLAQGYDVERSDMSLITKFFDAGTKVASVCNKDTEGMTDEEQQKYYGEIASSLWGVVESGASLMGIPAKNVAREVTSVVNFFSTAYKDLIADERDTTGGSLFDAVNDNFWESFPIVRNFYEHDKSEKLYDAIVAGDSEYVRRMKSGYKTESAYDSAVRKALKENDPRIKEAAEARVKGDIATKTKLLEEIVGEGHFSKDVVNQAINSAQNDITRDGAELLRTTDERIGKAAALKESDSEYQRIVNAIVREGKYSRDTVVKAINTQKGKIEDEEKDEVYSIFDTADINDAYENGDEELAHEIIDDLIATKVANGSEEEKARSSVRSSLTRYWKPIYKAAYEGGDTEECERIEDILADSGLYGKPKELRKTLKSWRKEDDEEEDN